MQQHGIWRLPLQVGCRPLQGFGQKPAGSPLNCVVLCLLRHGAMRGPAAGERRGASRRSLLCCAWVDYFAFYRWVRVDTFWMNLCYDLGVPAVLLNLEKRQLRLQLVDYAGFVFNTWKWRLLIQVDKLVRLLASVKGLGAAQEMSTRELDGVKGRVQHY
jgi:hypothetical protein